MTPDEKILILKNQLIDLLWKLCQAQQKRVDACVGRAEYLEKILSNTNKH